MILNVGLGVVDGPVGQKPKLYNLNIRTIVGVSAYLNHFVVFPTHTCIYIYHVASCLLFITCCVSFLFSFWILLPRLSPKCPQTSYYYLPIRTPITATYKRNKHVTIIAITTVFLKQQ